MSSESTKRSRPDDRQLRPSRVGHVCRRHPLGGKPNRILALRHEYGNFGKAVRSVRARLKVTERATTNLTKVLVSHDNSALVIVFAGVVVIAARVIGHASRQLSGRPGRFG
jgi:hypothetical protein